jgi:hypothetical protein
LGRGKRLIRVIQRLFPITIFGVEQADHPQRQRFFNRIVRGAPVADRGFKMRNSLEYLLARR